MNKGLNSSLLIGLTGGIGSGKTAASDLFAKKGVVVVDADVIARQALAKDSPLVGKVLAYFGAEVISKDGSLDRAALRLRVFNNLADKNWLENLVHPWVRERVLNQLASATGYYQILSSPLLLETGQDSWVDRILVIDVPVEVQIERTCNRDKNNRELVEKIISQQLSREQRLAKADDKIDNSQGLAELEKQVNSLHQFYLQLARGS